MQEIKIYSNKRLLYAGLTANMVVLLLFRYIGVNAFVGAIVLVVWVLLVIGALYSLFDRRPRLVISGHGITYRSLMTGTVFVTREHITGVDAKGSSYIIQVTEESAREVLERVGLLHRTYLSHLNKRYNTPLYISTGNLDCDKVALQLIIEDYVRQK